jgi:imidazolonepropionase-like amidohydrolase
VLPGSGNIVGGRSAIIRNYARTTTEALIARSGIKAAFGYNPMSTRDWKGTRPHTRMGALSLLRARLALVKHKMEAEATRGRKKAGGRAASDTALTAEDLVIKSILNGTQGLRVHVHKIDDIASLLRLQEEFGIGVTVDHACDVNDGHIYAVLKDRGIPVVFGPLDAFAYKVELKHENWRNVRHLLESGVDFGLMTDHPVIPQRNLFLELRWFMRCGLNRQDSIEIVTRRNAQILGLSGFLGTLDKGKWASFSCWNGDPFDVSRYPVMVFAEGAVVFEEG